MKRWTLFLLTVAMLLSLAACAGEPGASTGSTGATEITDPTGSQTTEPGKTESTGSTGGTDATDPTGTQATDPQHTHTYSEMVTDPTCTEKGYTTYACACGDSYKDQETGPRLEPVGDHAGAYGGCRGYCPAHL